MASSDKLYLLKDRRFLPMFITQFLGCFNDNLLKNSLVMIITYKATLHSNIPKELLILLANAVFIIPYIIFAGLAGQIADKFDKALIVKIIKLIEILFVCISIYGFWDNNLYVLFAAITLMGIHSTFFGPIKYSILPEHLRKEELLEANGLIEAGTFLSILIGTQFGGYAVGGVNAVLILMMLVAVGGFISSLYVLPSIHVNSDLKLNWNLFQETINITKYALNKKQVFLSILGISWFWFISAAFMTQIPSLTRHVFGADVTVANLFFAVFSIGVGCGSLVCNKLFRNEITTRYVSLAAIMISIFGIDLFFASRISSVSFEPEQLKSAMSFLSKKHNWRILVDLFFIAFFGGLYIVPLYAVVQYFSSIQHRSRVIAANNVFNALFMITSNLMLILFFKLGLSVTSIILIISLLNIAVAIYIYNLLPENELFPEPVLRRILKFVFDYAYKVEVKGIENFHKAGKRVVIIANHLSYIDPPLIGVYLPERISFVINRTISQEWWVKPFTKVVKTFPVDTSNAMAMRNLINEIKKNKKVAIFPEGRISTTGSLMKIYEGPGMIADKSDANILPIRVDGTQFTHFTKIKKNLKNRWFPKVTITILPPVKMSEIGEADSRKRRKNLSHKLYDIMTQMVLESSDYNKTIFQSLIDSAKINTYSLPIVQDHDNNILTYRQLISRSFILGSVFSKDSKYGQYVGVMLPNSSAAIVSIFGLMAFGRVPAMINYTSGANNILSACRASKLSIIYTSKKFIDKAGLKEVIDSIKTEINIVYLEDVKNIIGLISKIKGIFFSYFPEYNYNKICPVQDPDKPAVVLFTSGTEGSPKAVVLSNKNIQYNRCQMTSIIDLSTQDLAFNALPIFHSFGLAATIITTLSGINTYYYPTPLHYRIIPEVIYDIGATLMFGTDTFLTGYAKYAHPYDFYSLRYVFAGAEKLKPETRKFWLETFGVKIFEGYGTTETSPVISVNSPMHDKLGTVGRPLPGIEVRILPVDGINEGGRLFVKGNNVMLGYMTTGNPGVIFPPVSDKLGENWYDTGDIVTIDDDNFIKIIGRAKRFAKIAGEMVSLAQVEEIAYAIDNKCIYAAIRVSDEKKGENIILYSSSELVNKETMLLKIRELNLSELILPKEIVNLKEIPLLASGKVDYQALILKVGEGK